MKSPEFLRRKKEAKTLPEFLKEKPLTPTEKLKNLRDLREATGTGLAQLNQQITLLSGKEVSADEERGFATHLQKLRNNRAGMEITIKSLDTQIAELEKNSPK